MHGELLHTMLEPRLAGYYWRDVAAFVQPACDRFWMHWWFRPVNDKRPLLEQLINPDARPAPEPLPLRVDLALGELDRFVDTLQHSWICPNGAAAGGALTGEVLGLLLARSPVEWFDLHFSGNSVERFVATDAGLEHFAWLSEADMAALVERGVPRKLFRML